MATASRPRLLVPGLLPLDPGRETYRVRPGAATVVALEPDDRLTVRDLSGAQRAELTVVGAGGREDYEALEIRGGGQATVLRSLVSSAADGAARVVGALASSGLDPSAADGGRALRAELTGGCRGDVPRLAAGAWSSSARRSARAVVDGGVPASDLQLEVSRSSRRGEHEPELPEPLAETRLDFEVPRASALAYEVKAGEYIQVLDVKGRQCSDFLAFHGAKLQSGVERGTRCDHDPHADGQRVSDARALREVLRPGSGSARRGRARHGRAARHVRAGVQREVLRGHGVLRARQLLGQLQRAAAAVHDRAAQRLAGAQLLLQHGVRPAEPARLGRAVVAARRLRAAARADRPRVPLERVPRRRRPGERVEPDRDSGAGLPGEGAVLRWDRPPCDAGCRAEALEAHGVRPVHLRADDAGDRVQRLLAADLVRQSRGHRGVLGVPREGGDDGSVAAPQVGDSRARTRRSSCRRP